MPPAVFQELPGDNGAGFKHNFQVELDRHVLEIEEIHHDHLVEHHFVLAVYQYPVSPGRPFTRGRCLGS